LRELGVQVMLNSRVTSFDGAEIQTSDEQRISSQKVIWAAGITGNRMPGLPEGAITFGNRIKVDRYHRVEGAEGVFAIGDIAYMEEEAYPQGHPQVAQVAMQQAKHLAGQFEKPSAEWTPFRYRDLGAMATIGRNKAVVDLPKFKFQGFFAWLVWLFVHLFQILGVKNKLFIFLNWVWNYLTYDQSLRLIIRPKQRGEEIT